MDKIDLANLGLTERYIQEAQLYGGQLYIARVSAQHKDMYKVIAESGELWAQASGKLGYSASVSAEYPVVGDWVLIDRKEDQGGNAVIHQILMRKSCFERKAAGTGYERQIVAANIDLVFICMSLNNDYNLRRLERYLAIAWDSGAMPVIVLTKADLCTDINLKLMEIQVAAPGGDVLVTSNLSGAGYDEILRYLTKGKTAVFVGSSGVGKSTIINWLMGEDVLATKETRADDRGRHTTTHRQLLLIPNGGVVIDTPGMRELQLAGADLAKSFADIEELAEQCYFKDCQHAAEPKCAVKQAIELGTLTAKRLESYQKLQRELVFTERKSEMSAAQAEKMKIIEMMGSLDGVKQIQKTHRKYKGNQ